MQENQSMREIHEIREKHYEATKNLSFEEYIKTVREGANEAKKMMVELKKLKAN